MVISVESAAVQTALRESISNPTSNNNLQKDESITNHLAVIAKKILMSKIEYEEVNSYDQSVLENFKSKYTLLKPFSNGKLLNLQSENTTNNKNKNESIFNQNSNQQSNSHNNQLQQQKNTNELPHPKRVLFPREKVQIGWRSSGRKWQIGSGMMNVGNTCYLNSTLQALLHVPSMANWLLSDSEHRDQCRSEGFQEGCIICAMAKTLILSQTNSTPIRPQLVYGRLKQICKHLIFGRQEDAHEFLRYLVQAMEKSYLQRFKNHKELDSYSKETTPLNQILGGYLKTSVRCLSCNHVSVTFQHFQDLLLDIRKPNTIEEALDGYFAKEKLEDMGYKCESCKKKVTAVKQYTIEKAPICLCVPLKRFSMVGTKINKYISIKPRLDLSKYASNKNSKESLHYKLVAMVTHLGASQHCGHYTAIGLTDQGGYYQFDDSCVRPISLPNVLNTNAYIIFYELDENANSKPNCTQVSGEHRLFENDTFANHLKNGNSNHSECNNGSNYLFNSKTSNSNNEKHSNSTTNGFIGPQLPPGFLKNVQNDTNNKSNSTNVSFNKSQNKTNLNGNILSPSKATNDNSKIPKLFEKNKIDIFEKENKLKPEDPDKKPSSTLPSMPKLDTSTENSSSFLLNNSVNKTPTKLENGSIWMGPISPRLMKQNSTNTDTTENKTKPVVNGIKNSVKSLVPYGSDIDDDSNDSFNNKTAIKSVKLKENECSTITTKTLNGKNDCTTTSNETSPDSSPDFKETSSVSSPSNPPSPHVVKTKAGLWQVTPITPKGSPKREENDKNYQSETCTNTKYSNPFNTEGTAIPTSSFYSDKNYNNCQKSGVAKELEKYSHRGYGGSVLSWNGSKSEMDSVVNEEIRMERKRQYQDEDENDMDRGRQKKIKNNNYKMNDSNMYNPFQEQQIQKNIDNNRNYYQNHNNNHNSWGMSTGLHQQNGKNNMNKSNNQARYYQNPFISNNNSNCNNSNYTFTSSTSQNDNFGNKMNDKSKNINKFGNNMHKNNHYGGNGNGMNSQQHKNGNIHNKNMNKNFYRNDNMNKNNVNLHNNNYNKNNNGNKNFHHNFSSHNGGNNNFFRRHNGKKFNSNSQSGDWR